MRAVWYLLTRELSAFVRTPMGWGIMACALCIDGLLFNAWAVGSSARRSSEVLEIFFYCVSGTTVLASIFLSMRLIAEERQSGTLVLLATSPLAEWQIVWGKFLAALCYLSGITAATVYMPLLVWHSGKVSWGHVVAGYLGLFLLGAACLAIGTLCSAWASNQLVAAVCAAASITVMIVMWLLSRIASPPLAQMLAYLSLHDKHFRPFMRGIISSADVLFYISLTYFALLLATRVLEARRWR